MCAIRNLKDLEKYKTKVSPGEISQVCWQNRCMGEGLQNIYTLFCQKPFPYITHNTALYNFSHISTRTPRLVNRL